MSAEAKMILPLSEDELQAAIIEMAETLGWLVYHTRDSRGSAEGFPDLVLVREPRILFVELKGIGVTGRRGRVSAAQAEWLTRLGTCSDFVAGMVAACPVAVAGPVVPFVAARCWRPDEWRDGTVERELRAGIRLEVT